jgi:hypothetical protein
VKAIFVGGLQTHVWKPQPHKMPSYNLFAGIDQPAARRIDQLTNCRVSDAIAIVKLNIHPKEKST